MRDSTVTVPETLLAALKSHDRVLIAAHANPDGDAAGASAALGWTLRTLGKEVLLYNETGFPDYLGWRVFPARAAGHLGPAGKPGVARRAGQRRRPRVWAKASRGCCAKFRW